jgi:DtxR family Mn-dependent transcriptional regulator
MMFVSGRPGPVGRDRAPNDAELRAGTGHSGGVPVCPLDAKVFAPRLSGVDSDPAGMSSEPQARTAPSPAPTLADIERGAARYLFAIAVLSGSGTDRVTTGELHDQLDVAQPSVTGMVSKLDDRGLVEYEKYEGVTLTDWGETLARQAGWRLCVVSTFFDSELDTTLDDGTAFDIGFVLPERGVRRLRELVGSACLGRCPEANGDAERCAV